MKPHWTKFHRPTPCIFPDTLLAIQAPLPHCLDTLPKLLTIEGQGNGRQGPCPLAPPEEPTNDNA